MKTYCKPLSILVAAALGLAFSAAVTAADVTSKADYKQALKTAEADYKAAYAACPKASGPERLSCRRQAYAKLEKSRADAREAHGLPRQATGPRSG